MHIVPHILAEGLFSTGRAGIDPAFSLWLVLPVFAAALAVIVYYSLAQRKIAATRTIVALTILRVTLLALLLGLLLRPYLQWMNTSHSSGTLWILVDQSPSMSVSDTQASQVERLRWADALGYLPPNSRTYRPELDHAAVVCARADFSELRGILLRSSGGARDPETLAAAATGLGKLRDDLDKVVSRIRKAPSVPATALPPLESALSTARELAKSAERIKSEQGVVRDIASTETLLALANNLDTAAKILEVHSRKVDDDFLTAHSSDSAIGVALSRVDLTRNDLALQMLTASAKRLELSVPELMQKFRVRIATFSDSAALGPSLEVVKPPEAFSTALRTTGNGTDIATGLRLIGEQLGPEEPGAVIIVSDGRQNAPRSEPEHAAQELLARRVPVHVHGLLIGSAEVSPDAAVEPPQAREWIFKGDTLDVVAPIRLDGLAGQSVTVEFYRNGSRLDSKMFRAGSAPQQIQRVTFADKPPDTTDYEYEIRVLKVPGEANLANNSQTFRVAVKKDKLFALYIENQPRWEYQYLRNYLARDQRLKLQNVLLHPARVEDVTAPPAVKASPTNPGIDAQILPATRAEWSAFDLIVLGDVGPETLDAQTQQFIAAAVRDKGATLICIAGPANMPQRFAGGPLADVLPVTLTASWEPAELEAHLKSRAGFRPGISAEGDAVLRDFGLREAATQEGAPAPWEVWHWHSAFTTAKPSAQTVLTISENNKLSRQTANQRALVATMSLGLGKVLYLASDQTWRWRYLAGENGQDRFWGQVVRWSVGADLPAGGKFVRFGAERQTYEQGMPVTVTARVLREDLTPYPGLSFSAVAKPISRGATQLAASVFESKFAEAPESPGYYRATFASLPAGRIEISLRGAEVERLLNEDPTVTQRTVLIMINAHEDREMANTNTDLARLTAITTSGGGVTLPGDASDVLASHLPAIEHTYQTPEQAGLFTDPKNPFTYRAHWLFLILFAAVLATEWAVRKRAGLI